MTQIDVGDATTAPASGPIASPADAIDHSARSGEAANTAALIADLTEAAHNAESKQNWPAVIEIWTHVSALRPEDPAPRLGQALAYRALGEPAKADSVISDFLHNGRLTPELAVRLALDAQDRSDWVTALACWNAARLHYPEVIIGWASAVAMLLILERFDEAESVVSQAADRFGDSIDIAAQQVNVAAARQDWREAWRRWLSLETRHAGHEHLRRGGAETLDKILDGLRSGDVASLRAAAIAADAKQDWPVSLESWTALHRLGERDGLTWLGYGRALLQTRQFDQAEAVLGEGAALFPDYVELRANHAEVSSTQGDWQQAAARWQELMRTHGDVQPIWLMAAIAYNRAGLLDDAQSLISRAIAAEPERADLRIHHAKFAERAGAWSVAVARWDIVLTLRPDDLNILNSRGDAIWEENATRLESGSAAASSQAESPTEDATSLKQLVMRFEGLGDNCEFGIVQRRCGAEPIGLFRFAAITAPTLINLLHHDFEGFGDPAHLELKLTPGNAYMVSDRRGLYHMHSFVQKGSVEETKFLKQQVVRLGYLKKKLIEDIQEAEKVFVYKASEERVSDQTLRDLRRALQQYGDVTLLGVRRAETGHPKGTLHILDDRILVGYMETLYDGIDSTIDFASWKIVLQQAADYQSAFLSRSPRPAPADAH